MGAVFLCQSLPSIKNIVKIASLLVIPFSLIIHKSDPGGGVLEDVVPPPPLESLPPTIGVAYMHDALARPDGVLVQDL